MNPMTHPINNANRGIHQLRNEVQNIRNQLPGPLAQACPIVLVPGFSGWGQPFLGTVNYFGGFDSLPLFLSQLGYRVIAVRIGPISTNRDRACEIFQQLIDGSFDLPGQPPTRIPINFGNNHPSLDPTALAAAETWRAVLYNPAANPLPIPWIWNATNRINFICHSQGGTTIRYLIELLTGTSDPDLPQFLNVDRQRWIKSVVTLGTPHKGTTVTDVDVFASTGLDPLIDFITSCSFEPRQNRVYDLCLDHWGFSRQPGHTYQQMRTIIAPNVAAWWNGVHNGLYDNSLQGATNLALFAPVPSQHIYYFTMSFRATNQFPEDERLSAGEINNFLSLLPGDILWNPKGVWGKVTALLQRPLIRFGIRFGILPSLRTVLAWATGVANNHLGNLGYFNQIPGPGTKIPRPDMLPVIAFPSYAMGGRNIPPNVNINITSEQFRCNDGIVNTRSMDGPVGGPIDNGSFTARFAAFAAQGVRGRYWHIGMNTTIDHADQIGVFTDAATVNLHLSKTSIPPVAIYSVAGLR